MNAVSRIFALLSFLNQFRGDRQSPFPAALIHGVIQLIGMAVAIAILAAAMLVAGLYLAYQGLLRLENITPGDAVMIVALAAAALLAVLVYAVNQKIRGLQRRLRRPAPSAIPNHDQPLTSQIAEVANAFVDGLLQRPTRS